SAEVRRSFAPVSLASITTLSLSVSLAARRFASVSNIQYSRFACQLYGGIRPWEIVRAGQSCPLDKQLDTLYHLGVQPGRRRGRRAKGGSLHRRRDGAWSPILDPLLAKA